MFDPDLLEPNRAADKAEWRRPRMNVSPLDLRQQRFRKTVRGFDPTMKRYQYSVNRLYGSSAVYRSTFCPPFALTLDFKIEARPDRETQLLTGAMRTRVREPAESLS